MAYRNAPSRSANRQRPLREINMIPLIDIMLVLLIIFMVTAPLLTHAVKIKLPQVSSQPNRISANTIQLSVRQTGELWWNGEPIAMEQLEQRFTLAAAESPSPELHIHADDQTPYHVLARVMALASKASLSNMGFVSMPDAPSGK